MKRHLPLLLLCLLGACASPEPEPPKKAIPAPIRPLMQDPDAAHQHILDEPNVLFRKFSLFNSLGPLNHFMVRTAGIAEAVMTSFDSEWNPGMNWDCPDPCGKIKAETHLIYDTAGLCTQAVQNHNWLEEDVHCVTNWRYNAQQQPVWTETVETSCSQDGNCDTTSHFRCTFQYDLQGRLVEILHRSKSHAERVTFVYDDLRGLVLSAIYSTSEGFHDAIIFEAPGALDAAGRSRLAEDWKKAYMNQFDADGSHGRIEFITTDGYDVLARHTQELNEPLVLLEETHKDDLGFKTHTKARYAARIYAYDASGNLASQVTNGRWGSNDMEVIQTSRYSYDEKHLIRVAWELRELFGEDSDSSFTKTFYQYTFREDK